MYKGHPQLFKPRHSSYEDDRKRGAYWSGWSKIPPESRILVPEEFC